MTEPTSSLDLPASLQSGIRQTHLSLSHRCPRQLWFYLYRGPSKPGFFKLAGASGHKAIEHVLAHKLLTGEDTATSEVQEVFASHFDAGIQECEKSDGDPVKLKDKIAGETLPLWNREHAPFLAPKLVEEPFKLEVEGISIPVIGTIDLFEKSGRLADFKFRMGKKGASSQREVNRDFQLATYELALEARGEEVREIRQTQLMSNPEKPSAVLSIRQETNEIPPGSLLDEYAGVVKLVQAAAGNPELFPMTDPTNWWCSEKWCGWAERCPRFGGKHQ